MYLNGLFQLVQGMLIPNHSKTGNICLVFKCSISPDCFRQNSHLNIFHLSKMVQPSRKSPVYFPMVKKQDFCYNHSKPDKNMSENQMVPEFECPVFRCSLYCKDCYNCYSGENSQTILIVKIKKAAAFVFCCWLDGWIIGWI
jgi:hypothetical protein